MPIGFRFTSADLTALPDWEGVRWEIIDEDLYVSTPVDLDHQGACGQSWSHCTAGPNGLMPAWL